MLLPYRIDIEVDDRDVGTEIEKLPLFTYLLIIANALVFCSTHFFPVPVREMAYYEYGFIIERLEPFSLISHMFIHVGWFHILGNMYFLWLFGRAIELRIGRPVFMLLYFSSGIVGSFLQGALTPEYFGDIPGIGASAAISGVLGAFMILYPSEKVSCVYFSFHLRYAVIIELASIWVLGSWVAWQVVDAIWFSPFASENMVAYWAHIGGFIFGAAGASIVRYGHDLVTLLRRRSVTFVLEECSDLIRDGRAEEAETKLKAAAEMKKDDPLIFGELGRIKLANGDRSAARKMFRRSLKKGLKQKDTAATVAAYYGLVAAKARPVDNSMRLIIGRRFAKLRKYGHALGVMGAPFKPDGEMAGLDKLLYEIGDLFAGPLNDPLRASAAFSLLMHIFPHSPRALEVKYRLRRLRAVGRD
jgi:membrane associated rhomboid family serine protease